MPSYTIRGKTYTYSVPKSNAPKTTPKINVKTPSPIDTSKPFTYTGRKVSRGSSGSSSTPTTKEDITKTPSKEELKKSYGDFAPSNIITTKEGKKVYTSVAGKRFDTPAEAAAANIRIKAPAAFNKTSSVYNTQQARIARQFVEEVKTGKPEGYYLDPSTGRQVSVMAGKAPDNFVFVGRPGSLSSKELLELSSGVQRDLRTQKTRQIQQDFILKSRENLAQRKALEKQEIEKSLPKLSSNKIPPKGKKIEFVTSQKLLEQGAFGTVLEAEKQALQPLTSRGLDLGTGIRQFGLGVASIPGQTGQLLGTGIAQFFGKKPVFKTDEEIIVKTTSGKDIITEAKTPQKFVEETSATLGLLGTSLLKDPVGTGQKIGSGLVEEVRTKPFSFIGETIGFAGLTKVGGTGLKIGSKLVSKGIGRPILIGKEVLGGKTLKESIRVTRGGDLGAVKTDLVSKIIGRKTIDLKDITSKNIADDFLKGKSQFLIESSERKLVQQSISGKQAKFIKQLFPDELIGPDDVIVFTAEGTRPLGIVSKLTGRTKVDFTKVGAEPFGKFAASRTATGPFAFIDDPLRLQAAKFKLFPSLPGKVSKPSVTVSVGRFTPLSKQGGIAQSIKRLGFDISKTSDDVQKAFFGKLRAGSRSRPIKLNVLREKFGSRAVAKGQVKSVVEGKITQSPSRLFGKTIEEELIIPFGSKGRLLAGFKERVFGKSIVKLGGKRVKLDIQRLINTSGGETSRASLSKQILGKALGSSSKVSAPVSEISLGPSLLASSFFKGGSSNVRPLSSKISSRKPSVSQSISSSSKDLSSSISSTSKSFSSGISVLSSIVSSPSSPSTISTSSSSSITSTTSTQSSSSQPSSPSTPSSTTRPSRISQPSSPSTPISTITRTPPLRTTSRPQNLSNLTRKTKKQSAYSVYVRRSTPKGKSKVKEQLVDTGLPFNSALRKGARIADNYTDRTFILKKKGTTKQRDTQKPRRLLEKFRGPKSKKLKSKGRLVFVEKSKHAIDSHWEKLGIPYKAIKTKKKKKLLGKLNIKV